MQAPPDMMPDRFGVFSLAALDQFGDFPSQDVGDRTAVSSYRVGVAGAFDAIGIANAEGDEFERLDLAVGAVGERNSERDTVESGLGRLDARHLLHPVFLQVRPIVRRGQCRCSAPALCS